MNDKKSHTNLSKFLSLVLRHKPETIGLSLSEQGWVDTQTLIKKMNDYGKQIDFETLSIIVETNNKKRFGFSEDKTKIRANQGHSLDIDLGYVQKTPPDILYHGTAQKYTDNIFKVGIEKRNRHQVHLSKVLSKQMHENGFKFFESENNVWLTDHVPVKYLIKNENIGD